MSSEKILHKVITSNPIDRTAAKVTGPGIHYEPPKKNNGLHWDAPPPTIPIPKHVRKNPQVVDCIGKKFGRFTVVGLYTESPLWLVRCNCGHYETRKQRAILNPGNGSDCCDYCRHLLYLKRHSRWRSTGEQLTVEDVYS